MFLTHVAFGFHVWLSDGTLHMAAVICDFEISRYGVFLILKLNFSSFSGSKTTFKSMNSVKMQKGVS
jgi:hypothetical protein